MTNINLDYGKQTLKIDVPDSNLQELCSIKDKPGVSNVEAEILRAINNPIGGPRIDQMAKPGAKAVLLVDDYLRKTPASIILPIVVNELSKAGVKDSDIEIIVARGTHPKMNEEKQRAKVGDAMYDRFKVSNHDCDDPDQLELYGLSSRGTNIQLNKKVHSADVVIGIGGIKDHTFMGYSGGAKMVLPGVVGRKTVYHNHNCWHLPPRPYCIRGIASPRNKIREDVEEIAEITNAIDMKIDVVMNTKYEVVKAFAGHINKEFYEGIKFYDKMYKTVLSKHADIVVGTANPTYANLFFSGLGIMLSSDLACKDGGDIILAINAPGGLCSRPRAMMLRLLQLDSLGVEKEAMREKVELEGAGLINFWNAAMLKETGKRLTLVSEGITKEETTTVGWNYSTDINKSLNEALDRQGKDASVVVIPDSRIMISVN